MLLSKIHYVAYVAQQTVQRSGQDQTQTLSVLVALRFGVGFCIYRRGKATNVAGFFKNHSKFYKNIDSV